MTEVDDAVMEGAVQGQGYPKICDGFGPQPDLLWKDKERGGVTGSADMTQ